MNTLQEPPKYCDELQQQCPTDMFCWGFGKMAWGECGESDIPSVEVSGILSRLVVFAGLAFCKSVGNLMSS